MKNALSSLSLLATFFAIITSGCSKLDEVAASGVLPGTVQWSSVNQLGVAGKTTTFSNIRVSKDGNVAMAGATTANLDTFDKTATASTGTQDGMVVQVGTTGATAWVRQVGVASHSVDNTITTVDASGNVFLVGTTDGNVASPTGGAATGTKDIFIIKYDSAGTLLWRKEFGVASTTTVANAVAVDTSGNVYLTGKTNANLEAGAGAATGTFELFVMKLAAATGAQTYVVQEGKTAGKSTEGRGIAVDATGNVIVAGNTTGDIDGGGLRGTNDGVVIKYDGTDTTGKTKTWTKQEGVSGATTSFESADTDSAGRVVVTGSTTGNHVTGTGASTGLVDGITTEYDSNSTGTQLWVSQEGAPGKVTHASAVRTDQSNNVVIAGETDGNVFAGTGSSTGTQDGFVTKYASTGAKVWTKQMGQTGKTVVNSGLDVDASGNVIVAGHTDGNPATGTGTSVGTNDGFGSVIDPNGTIVGASGTGTIGGTGGAGGATGAGGHSVSPNASPSATPSATPASSLTGMVAVGVAYNVGFTAAKGVIYNNGTVTLVSSPDVATYPKLSFRGTSGGIVVGSACSSNRRNCKGAVYSGGVVTLMSPPNAGTYPSFTLTDVSGGVYYGYANSADDQPNAAGEGVYYSNGSPVEVVSPDGALPYIEFDAASAGVAVGFAHAASAYTGIKGVYYQNGTVTLVPSPDLTGHPDLYLTDVSGTTAVGRMDPANASYNVKGVHYAGGTVTAVASDDLVTYPHLSFNGISESGTVVGRAFKDYVAQKGVIYENGTLTLVSSPDMAAHPMLDFAKISNGVIVGSMTSATYTNALSVIYENGTFTTVTSPDSDYSYIVLSGIGN